MRSLCLGLALALAGCGTLESQHPPEVGDESDAGTDATAGGTSPGPGTTPPEPIDADVRDSSEPVPPVCHGCVDAGHDAGHDAGVDSGPKPPEGDGGKGCPAACTLEPAGVPPCSAPLRPCDCTTAVPLPSGCEEPSGESGGTLFCCP